MKININLNITFFHVQLLTLIQALNDYDLIEIYKTTTILCINVNIHLFVT